MSRGLPGGCCRCCKDLWYFPGDSGLWPLLDRLCSNPGSAEVQVAGLASPPARQSETSRAVRYTWGTSCITSPFSAGRPLLPFPPLVLPDETNVAVGKYDPSETLQDFSVVV